ncbi:hypothetical protein [Sphingobium sp. AS12]|nr:hypothetical protein [Sphingobium sp. AS12]
MILTQKALPLEGEKNCHMTFRYPFNVILNLFQDPSRPKSRRP